MRRVMVFGSFDPLHDGHRSLFRQAKRYGEELYVVVALDANIKRLKEHDARVKQEERLQALKREPLVDEVILGHESDFLHNIIVHAPDVLILGYDQTTFEEDELRRLLQARGVNPEIKRAVAFKPETYKSSKLAKKK